MPEGPGQNIDHNHCKIEKRQLKKLRKQTKRNEEARQKTFKKGMGYALIVLFFGGGLFGIIALMKAQPNLPVITGQGHVESSPPSHIVNKPIAEAVQRHVLEHADGKGKPGIIIQYNCDDFDCESDLISNLSALVKEYPENVYLAPNDYDGKIILTKMGKMEILEAFDETFIRKFIN